MVHALWVSYVISVMSDSLHPHGLYPTRLLCLWDSPGKNTGVGCHALIQGIFPTQPLNPGLLYWRWILYCLSHQGSPFLFGGSLIVFWALNTLLLLWASDFRSVNPHLIYPDTTSTHHLCAHMLFCKFIFSSSYCTTVISFVHISTHFSLQNLRCL